MEFKDIQKLAHDSVKAGDPSGWFEKLYHRSAGNAQHVPWADLRPKVQLVKWLEDHEPHRGSGLVVGCGLGDDAEALSKVGYKTTSFDVSHTAIEWCRRRFPQTSVKYETQDLFKLPTEWKGAFDFIFEAFTIQALPVEWRERAISAIAELLAPGGRLLVYCSAEPMDETFEGPPWPLKKTELDFFLKENLQEKSFETLKEGEGPLSTSFFILYERAKS